MMKIDELVMNSHCESRSYLTICMSPVPRRNTIEPYRLPTQGIYMALIVWNIIEKLYPPSYNEGHGACVLPSGTICLRSAGTHRR